jgi:hypothetical protein
MCLMLAGVGYNPLFLVSSEITDTDSKLFHAQLLFTLCGFEPLRIIRKLINALQPREDMFKIVSHCYPETR